MELLEREQDLSRLDGWLAEVRENGRGQLVLIAGEAGVGKTALVRAFAERQQPAATLVGACEALFTPRPLGPFVDILGGDVPEDLAPGDVLAALAGALTETPILVLEDLHWADEATLDVLHLLGRRGARLPALVLATYRDDQLSRADPLRLVLGELGAAHRVTLAPLSAGAVERLAAGHDVDGAQLHARTGGNPFFVTEVLARSGEATPVTVRDAVLARAARLPERARDLLEAVAIARPRAEIRLLEEIAPDALGELEACLSSGMLRAEREAVAFRHEIARATIEDELPPHRRVALHRAALAALSEGGEPARLAHHAEAADDGAAVLRHAVEAGERAARLRAHREAAAHFAAALRHAEPLPPAERAALLKRRAQACFLSGLIEGAIDAESSALALHVAAGDRLGEGDAHRRLALYAWYQGDGESVEREGATAVEILEAQPPSRELALAYASRATRRMMDYDLAGTRALGNKSIELARDLDETEVLVAALLNVGTAEHSHGLGDEKVRHSLELALGAGLVGHVAVAYCNLVSGAYDTRDYAAAATHLEAGRAFCDQHDLLSWGTYLAGWQARIALDQGHWTEAAETARDTLERTHGALPNSRLNSLLVLGVLHARRGDGSPWPALDEAARIAAGSGELERLAPAAVARAEAFWLTGASERIDEETAGALARAEASGHGPTIGALAVWRARAGIAYAGGDGLPAPYREELTGEHRAAADVWAALGCAYDAALALGTCPREEEMRDGLDAFLRLGARPAAAVVARRLRERGVRGVHVGPRAATRANPVGLTTRQLDVLALIARGDRNADIAAKLFLSEKTVGHHVSAILGKLGVRTRGQAAAEAARLGIVEARDDAGRASRGREI